MDKWTKVFERNILERKYSIHIKGKKLIAVTEPTIVMQICKDEFDAQAKATLLRIEFEKMDPDKIFKELMDAFGWEEDLG